MPEGNNVNKIYTQLVYTSYTCKHTIQPRVGK